MFPVKHLLLPTISRSFDEIKQFLSPSNSLYIISLLALIGCSFYKALDNEFVLWDDQVYVTENLLLLYPDFESFKQLWYTIISLNYHPITMISLWLNAYCFGTASATPFILSNLVFHSMTSVLVYFFIRTITIGNHKVAFITALIFGIHPMHVESVVWVSERKDVLYAFFFMLSAMMYLRYLQYSKRKDYWATFLFFVLACGSKAMAVSFVPVLFLIDYSMRHKSHSLKQYVEKIPFLVLGLLVGWVAMKVQAGGDFYGLLEQPSDATALSQNFNFGIWQKLNVASYGLFFYIKNFLFPFQLSALHPYDAVIGQAYFAYFAWFGIAFLALLGYSFLKNRRLFFGLGFYILTILLVLQVIPVGVAIVAERYTYLPYIGLGYLLGIAIDTLFFSKAKNSYWGWGLIVLLAGSLSFLSTRYVDIWQDHSRLFTNVVQHYPDNPYAREYLAMGYWKAGELDSAIYHLDYAIHELNYINSISLEQLAICWEDKGDLEQALAFYNQAIALDSLNYTALYHRSALLIPTAPQAALADLMTCKNSNNKQLKQLIYEPMSRCYIALKDYENTVLSLSKAIRYSIDPHETKLLYYNRAASYERLNDYERAIRDYRSILQLDPTFEDATQRIRYLTNYLDETDGE